MRSTTKKTQCGLCHEELQTPHMFYLTTLASGALEAAPQPRARVSLQHDKVNVYYKQDS